MNWDVLLQYGVLPFVAAVIGWLVARMQRSGSVKTSEAADLWAESQSFRKDLMEEVRSLRARVFSLEEEVRELRSRSYG